MDLSKLSLGDKVIGVSGILLFIFSFFKWLGYKAGVVEYSASAWSFTLCWFAVVLGILLVAYVVLVKLQGMALPETGTVTANQLVLGVAVVCALFILIKIVAGASLPVSGVGLDKTRKIGIFLGFLSSLGLVAGAYLNAKEAGELPGPLAGKGGATPPSA